METNGLNLKVKLKETAPCQKELSIEIPAEAVLAEFDAVYQSIKKEAKVPGFRPGQAPRDLLEKHHGQTAREEVIRRLVSRSLSEALKPHNHLDLVGRPAVADLKLEANQPMSYVAKLEIAPEVKLGTYKGLKLTRPPADTSDEKVTEVLQHLQDTHAELKTVLEPRAAAEGDYLLMDITEKPAKGAPRTQKGAVVELNLKNDTHEVLKALLGMNPGENRSVQTKDGIAVEVSLKEIKSKTLPALDDAFAKQVGTYESLEALKSAVTKDLERQAEMFQKQALETQVVQQLVDNWKFDLPPSLVSSQAAQILKQRSTDLVNQGVSQKDVDGQAQVLTDQAKLEALKQVKLFFILRRIASTEKIQVPEEEMNQKIQELAGNLQKPVEEVRKNLQDKDLLEELAWGMIRSKVMDLVLKEANIKDGKQNEKAA